MDARYRRVYAARCTPPTPVLRHSIRGHGCSSSAAGGAFFLKSPARLPRPTLVFTSLCVQGQFTLRPGQRITVPFVNETPPRDAPSPLPPSPIRVALAVATLAVCLPPQTTTDHHQPVALLPPLATVDHLAPCRLSLCLPSPASPRSLPRPQSPPPSRARCPRPVPTSPPDRTPTRRRHHVPRSPAPCTVTALRPLPRSFPPSSPGTASTVFPSTPALARPSSTRSEHPRRAQEPPCRVRRKGAAAH